MDRRAEAAAVKAMASGRQETTASFALSDAGEIKGPAVTGPLVGKFRTSIRQASVTCGMATRSVAPQKLAMMTVRIVPPPSEIRPVNQNLSSAACTAPPRPFSAEADPAANKSSPSPARIFSILRNAHADQVDAINRLTARRRIYPRVLALIGTQVERVQMRRAISATTQACYLSWEITIVHGTLPIK